MNRLLTDVDRKHYEKLIVKMFELCPDTMSRKIERANIQQAFMLEIIGRELEARPGATILCVGSLDDTASECLRKQGVPVTDIDPVVNNICLHDFVKTSALYDIVFSTSVIEHVEDDDEFMQDICNVLDSGGLAVLTCDFKDDYKVGDPLIYPDFRFYTNYDLNVRLRTIIENNDCYLVGEPSWVGDPDFELGGFKYSFATIVFRKNFAK